MAGCNDYRRYLKLLDNPRQAIEMTIVVFSPMRIRRVSSANGGPMARSGPSFTEAQWQKIAPCFSDLAGTAGVAAWSENRRVLEGISWILRSGARWQDLLEKYPHPSTC